MMEFKWELIEKLSNISESSFIFVVYLMPMKRKRKNLKYFELLRALIIMQPC